MEDEEMVRWQDFGASRCWWIVVLLGLLWCGDGVSAARGDDAVKVLFIGKKLDHPFATHMYLHTGEMLAECLKLSGNIKTVVSDGWPEDAGDLEGVRTIVLYMTPAADFLLDGPHRAEFEAMMKRGVGLVTLHWASSVQQKNLERIGETWMGYLGGTWVSNVGLHTGKSPLRQLAPEHPISRGWEEYEIHDEYYLNPTIGEGATPILQVMALDKPVVVGWAFERPGGGRSFGTTLGHYYRNFQREPFRRMVVNSILWTAKVDVPELGARVDLPVKQLALPEQPEK
ncbi:MAG: type 1 glutamine amidotransferase [Porticoccaceae bacterium]|jgi:type 1 glutamine amidotransferase